MIFSRPRLVFHERLDRVALAVLDLVQRVAELFEREAVALDRFDPNLAAVEEVNGLRPGVRRQPGVADRHVLEHALDAADAVDVVVAGKPEDDDRRGIAGGVNSGLDRPEVGGGEDGTVREFAIIVIPDELVEILDVVGRLVRFIGLLLSGLF